MRVEKPHLARKQIHGQRQHDRADHAVADEPEPQVRFAAELEARQRIGGRRAERYRKRGGAGRHDDGVDDAVDDALIGDNGGVVRDGGMEQPDRRVR